MLFGCWPEEFLKKEGSAASQSASDPSSWVGPLLPEEESGSGMHGLHLNSRAGNTWKERMAGGEEL